MVDRLLIGLLTGGHILLEGVPGLAKTLAVRTLAAAPAPELQPHPVHARPAARRRHRHADLQPAPGEFTIKKGPVFANLVLADEINRAPAKVQSALLEAMQEKQVTIGDHTYPLEQPFLVLATQNPIEQEGTYPLPEAQVDRFMLKLKLTYPSKEEELAILDRMAAVEPELRRRAGAGGRRTSSRLRAGARRHLHRRQDQALHRGRRPRHAPAGASTAWTWRRTSSIGASPRATIFLTRAAKGQAFLDGRGYVTPQDVKTIGYDVLRHRVSVTYEAEAEDITSEEILKRIFDHLKVP